MQLEIPTALLKQIHSHGEAAYPNEGAGFLLGSVTPTGKLASAILLIKNSREETARYNRYLIKAEDFVSGEEEADRLGLQLIGVFHSHPDHPGFPSDFDRQWALPWFSYLITSVQDGIAVETRSWLLKEDRSAFAEEIIIN